MVDPHDLHLIGTSIGAVVASARAFDVYGRARGYDGPVRVLHGGRDFVPATYAAAYADIYGDAMQYTLVPEADHGWETIRARDLVLDETVRFVVAHAGSRATSPNGSTISDR